MRKLLENAAERALHYLEGLDARGVAPNAEAIANLSQLDENLPDLPGQPDDTLRLLDEIGSPATMRIAGRRFFGFVIGGSLPVTLAANWLAGAWDQNSALYAVTPGTAHLEQVALRWLIDLFNLPAGSGGAFVTGATVANFAPWQPPAMPSLKKQAGMWRQTGCSALRRSAWLLAAKRTHP